MEDNMFASVEDECNYWKERCLKLSQERNDVQREFDDFTEESRQLEAELEMTVEQQEKKIRDLNHFVNQLKVENESYKKKIQNADNETNRMDSEYKQLLKDSERYKSYIRELEQKNDDLERANRVASESVAEFESMLNQAYEKNALLELEVDEKERMQVKLQRLMDEARDLKQELKVRNVVKLDLDDLNGYNSLTSLETVSVNEKQTEKSAAPSSNNEASSGSDLVINFNNSCSLNINNNNQSETMKGDLLHTEIATAIPTDLQTTNSETAATTASSTTHQNNIKNNLLLERNGNLPVYPVNHAMAPSDRVSTLNIVADLLRRLDNMEAKLKAWKIRKPSSRTNLSQRHLHSNHTNHLNNHDSNLSLNSIGSLSDNGCCGPNPSSHHTIGTQTLTNTQKPDLLNNS